MTPECDESRLRWYQPDGLDGPDGSPDATGIRDAVELWQRQQSAGSGQADAVLAEGMHRRVVRLRTPGGRSIVVKQFLRPPRIRTREAVKQALGRNAAKREWRGLRALARAGAAVPAPLARARHGREDWLVLEDVAGVPLDTALASCSGNARRALLAALGERIGAVHRAGWIHGDLHVGNLRVAGGQPILLDLQRARATRATRLHDRDLAAFDFSMARAGFALTDRMRVRRAALAERADRETVRRLGRLAAHCERDHVRGRTRRCLSEGRRFARLRSQDWVGMRVRTLSQEEILALFDRHAETLARGGAGVVKHDRRSRVTRVALRGSGSAHAAGSVIVKEVVKGGAARRLADLLRGSPARRGWIAGHGLEARAIPAAQPLAFARRRGSGGGTSLLVLEDLGATAWLEDPMRGPIPAEKVCDALVGLLLRLHRQGVDHGDLQSAHLYGADAPRLIDLEGVRFVRRADDELRIRALAELNASLPDALVPATLRCRALARYARALPFEGGERWALEEVVRRSLARRHRWRGEDCPAAGRLSHREP